MLQEYEDYAPKIDEVNDLGNSYEAMVNPNERPMSPIRRMGRKFTFPDSCFLSHVFELKLAQLESRLSLAQGRHRVMDQ